MNFFEHQQRARQRTVFLTVLFMIAAATTVVLANAIMLATVAAVMADADQPLLLSQWLALNPDAVVWTSLGTLGFIGSASLYRMLRLGGGGGGVARSIGAVLVDADSTDPLKRQLLNVVEEMALAAGVPVPQVYVLEQESGINAFAAGFGPADAAITVTRGTLEFLTRDELQGVIAHEFSHAFNGDMRLNTRLLGILFGLLVIGLVGRGILRVSSSAGGRRGGAPIALAGFALVVIGYIGLMFGNLIRAAVSRQREFLADASAVQFTRNPLGIAGALKKIAVSPGRSVFQSAEAEELSHMLIADGRKSFRSGFATHPPILARIRAIDPHFDAAELERIPLTPIAMAASARAPTRSSAETVSTLLSPAMVIAAIGNPSDRHIETAARRHADIPESLRRAARSATHAPSLVVALALNKDTGERARQLTRLYQRLPQTLFPHLDAMLTLLAPLAPEQRLPLVDLAFPALRQRPGQDLEQLVNVIDELTRMDGRFDVLDYALVRLLRVQLGDAVHPRASATGAEKIHTLRNDAGVLFAVLAQAGDNDVSMARIAYEQGMQQLLGGNTPAYAPPAPWPAALDRALTRLDGLAPLAKQALIEAMVVTIFHDKRITLGETELLRAICASLHCPVPPLEISGAGGGRAGSPDAAA